MALVPIYRLRIHPSYSFSRLSVLLLAGATLLATGCHPAITDPKDPKFIVAEKGSWHYTRGELDTEIANLLQQQHATAEQVGPANMPKLETRVLDNIVLKKLILDKAATLPLKDVDKDEAAQLEAAKQQVPPGQTFEEALKTAGVTLEQVKKIIHEQVLIADVLKAEAFKDTEPTEQEINDFYLKHQEAFNIPAKVRVSRILIHLDEKIAPADKAAKKKIIDKAHDRVAKGEQFSTVATQVSEDRSSAPNGGDIGFFEKGVSEPGLDEVAFNTKVGVVSPVFETPLGYEFIKVTDIQAAGVVAVADARPKIEAYLRKQKMGHQEEAYAKNLLATGGVTYHLFAPDVTGSKSPSPAPGSPSTPPPAPH